jgi:CRP-like cAMP-binding protein
MALDQDVAALQHIPPFDLFEPEALRLVAFSAETRILRAGDILFKKGQPSDGGYLVTGGTISLDADDNGSPAADTVGPGALVGALAMFAATERPATAIARAPSTVLKISRSLMRRVLENHPLTARRVQERIGAEVRGTEMSLAGIEQGLEGMARLLGVRGR